jgi:hypothetical protein
MMSFVGIGSVPWRQQPRHTRSRQHMAVLFPFPAYFVFSERRVTTEHRMTSEHVLRRTVGEMGMPFASLTSLVFSTRRVVRERGDL